MKVFVDDERDAPDGWHLVKDVETAIRVLATFPNIDEISLDHDAGSGTFQPVAYFIGEKYHNDMLWGDLEVKIHSANPVGRKKLKEILDSYGVPSFFIL